MQVTPCHSSFLLQDGYIARTFGTKQARDHFKWFLKRDVDSVEIFFDGATKCFFIPHNTLGSEHQPILLDHYAHNARLVVYQFYWVPRTDTDFGRYVWKEQLENVVFFGYLPGGGGGLSVTDAAAGNCLHIRNSDAAFSSRGKSSTQIRIVVRVESRMHACSQSLNCVCCFFQWPGYDKQLQRQVQTKDETPEKKTITLRKFIQHVGRSVETFFKVGSSQPLTIGIS